MMRLDKARQMALNYYPNGPERIADELGVVVRESPLVGCDGWVLSGPAASSHSPE